MNTFGGTSSAVAAVMVAGGLGVAAAAPAAHAVAPTHRQAASASKAPVLHYGMTGAGVRLAQQKLTILGYRIAVDGSFGPKMRTAVRSFQRDQHIAVDGHVGPVTWSRLNSASAAANRPTLGLADWGGNGPQTRGFGQVRPTVIDNGCDPTGLVNRVTWSTWGGHTANGTGIGWYVGPKQSVAYGSFVPASVVAYDLTTCGGHPAYRHVAWWFPSKGETYRSAMKNAEASYNICTGN